MLLGGQAGSQQQIVYTDTVLYSEIKHMKHNQQTAVGCRNSSVGSVLDSLSCVTQRHAFEPPLSFRYRGFFLRN